MSFIINFLTNYCYGIKFKALKYELYIGLTGKRKIYYVILLENLERKEGSETDVKGTACET